MATRDIPPAVTAAGRELRERALDGADAHNAQSKRGWMMGAETWHYWDASMHGCGSRCGKPIFRDYSVVADVFDVSEDERDAFALAPEVECAVLHWSEHGGAPKLRYRTRADVDQFFAADDEEA